MFRFILRSLCIFFIIVLSNSAVLGISDYRNTIPNGDQFRCSVCHISNLPPVGAPTFELNAFGRDYKREAIPAGSVFLPLWTRDLARLDSDNDGYTNGEELQEITGDVFVWEARKFGSNDTDWDLAAGVPTFARNPGDGDLSIPRLRFNSITPSDYTVNVGERITVTFSGEATVPGRDFSVQLTGSSSELEGIEIRINTETVEVGRQEYNKVQGTLTWTPAELQGGNHTIAILLSDGTSSEVNTIKINVLGGTVVLPGNGTGSTPEVPPVKVSDFTVSTFDFDNSLLVDMADFTLFSTAYGQRAALDVKRFDFNQSGLIDWPDFLFFSHFFNKRVNVDVTYRTPARDQLTFVPVTGGSFVQQIDGLFQRVNILSHDMGKFEISNRQYNNFLQANNDVLELTPAPLDRVVFATRVAEQPTHPVVGVSWEMADAYCKWAGGRLPLLKEWRFAARGLESRKFAHGDNLEKNQANFLNSDDPFEPGTTPIGYYNRRLHMEFQTADAFSLSGAYDMTGNVWEWCGDSRPNQAPIIGGSYLDPISSDDLDLGNEQWISTDEKRESVGFRCLREK